MFWFLLGDDLAFLVLNTPGFEVKYPLDLKV